MLGGPPELMMRNASGLSWIGGGLLMFSELKRGLHMAVVTTTENRSDERNVYIPAREVGMAHRSYLSPDHRWVLIAEMDNGWLPCRLVPFDGSSSGRRVGPPGAACTSAAWSPEGRWMYFSSNQAGRFHIWRQQFPDGDPEQVTSGPTEEEGISMAPDGRSLITSVGAAQSSLWLHHSTGEQQVFAEASPEEPRFSKDGKKLLFIVRRGLTSPARTVGELWAMDLDSGLSERLLPGILVDTFDISPDSKYVVVISPNGNDTRSAWLAPLDRRSPLQRINSPPSVSDFRFDPAGGFFFAASEGESDFTYHINEVGSRSFRVLSTPVLSLKSVSPDGQWVIVRVAVPGGEVPRRALMGYPVRGGVPRMICDNDCPAGWTPDGKLFYFCFHGNGMSESGVDWKTALIPLAPGQDLPNLPASGVNSPKDLAGLAGVKLIPIGIQSSPSFGVFGPGPDSTTYAFTRTSVHRNLYRIPVP